MHEYGGILSQGRRFIQSAIRDGLPGALRLVGEGQFIEEELPLYEFVVNHHARYGSLPGTEVLVEHGFRLPALEGDQPCAYHIDRLRDRYVFNLVNQSLPLITTGMQEQDMEVVIAAFRDTLATVGTAQRGQTASALVEEIRGVIEDYHIARRTTTLRGVTLGWPSIDAVTLGAMPGDLIVVVGRPGLGKTNVLINMAYSAWLMSRSCLFVSMEMGKLQIARRWVGRHTGINPNLIRSGRLSRWGEELLNGSIQDTDDAAGNVYLESGDCAREVDGIESTVLQFNPEVLYIDAAYLMTPSGQKRGYISKWEQVSMVVGQLKQLALRYSIPVIITVQFNRNQKGSSTSAPDLGDIAGADSIPQDASIVIGLQKAPAPYELVRRLARMMKSREGDNVDIVFNYRFEPVDFSEVSLFAEEGAQEPVTDLSWMV